jgi:hypothetical protein
MHRGSPADAKPSIEVVEWLRQEQGDEIRADVMMAAAGGGQTAMCKHLRSTGCDWNADACRRAAECGHLNTLRWLRESGCPCNVKKGCFGKARRGRTDILDFVIEQGAVLDAELLTRTLHRAGARSHLQAAQWLRQHGAQWPAVLSYGDAPNVRQWSDDMIAWARAEGCTSPIAL